MENDCKFVNLEVEAYIAQWPNPKFDGSSIASQLRESSGVTHRLYAEVQHIWTRLKVADDEITILRKFIAEVVKELNSILED